MIGIRLVWSGGDVAYPQARVVRDAGRREVRGEVTPDGRVLPVGDRGVFPEPLVVEVEVQGTSWPDTIAQARRLVQEAESAGDGGSVITPRGTRAVRRLLHHERRTEGIRIRVSLSFLPASEVYA